MKESALTVEDGESMNSGVDGEPLSCWLKEAVMESMKVLLDNKDPSTRTPFICKSEGLTSMRGGMTPENLVLLLMLRECCCGWLRGEAILISEIYRREELEGRSLRLGICVQAGLGSGIFRSTSRYIYFWDK